MAPAEPGEVPIPREEDDTIGLGRAQQLEEPCALAGQIAPSLPAVPLHRYLHGGDDQTQLGRLAQPLFEPSPLRLDELDGAHLAVDVVTGKDEHVRIVAEHRIADRLGKALIGAGAEGDPARPGTGIDRAGRQREQQGAEH